MHGWAATTSLQLSAPEQEFLVPASPNATVRRRRSATRARAPSPSAASGSAVVSSSIVGLVAVLVAASAVFGTVQWRSAVDAKGDVDDLLMVDRLVTASTAATADDPELALLLAMQSVRQTVDLGFATEEAVDAVHFALQELGVQYDVDPGTPVAVRSGPHGPVGVYALPPSELMELAESAVRRALTDAECQEFLPTMPGGGRRSRRPGAARRVGRVRGDRQRRSLEVRRVTISRRPLRGNHGFARELAAFTERTGIAVELHAGSKPRSP